MDVVICEEGVKSKTDPESTKVTVLPSSGGLLEHPSAVWEAGVVWPYFILPASHIVLIARYFRMLYVSGAVHLQPDFCLKPIISPKLAVAFLALSAGLAESATINLTNVTLTGGIAPNTITGTSGQFRGGFINNALFRDPSVDGSAGSGVFRDLYRLTPPNGPGNVTESGYNRVEMDSSVPNGFDPFIRVSDLVSDSSDSSYIFVIDLNEANNATDRYLSLDDFKVWVGEETDPTVLPSSLTGLNNQFGVPAYDMQAGTEQNTVLLDATLSNGSGGGDVFIFIPKTFFAGADANDYVYVYTAMGGYTGQAGFGAGSTSEQVSIPGKTITGGGESTISTIDPGVPVPEPGTAALALMSAALLLRRRRV